MKLITLAEKYNYTCCWCGYKFPLECLSRDHVIPLNKHKRSNGDNCDKSGIDIKLSCKCCNQSRGKLPFQMYKKLIKKI